MTSLTSSRIADLRLNAQNFASRIKADSLVRNSLYIMATTVVTSGLGYLFWIAAARTHTAFEVGLVSALLAATNLASSLTNLGFSATIVQVLAGRPAGQRWSLTLNSGLLSGTIIGLGGAVITTVVFLLSDQFSSVVHNPLYLILFIMSVPLLNVFLMHDAAFTAERVAGNMLLHNTVFAVVKLVLLIVFLGLPIGGIIANGISIFAAWQIAALLAAVIGFLLTYRLKRGYRLTAVNGFVGEVRSTFGALVGHHLINVGSLAPVYVLPVIVTILLSPADNAFFSTAWLLRSIYSMISVSVAASLFAEGSYKQDQIMQKARASVRIITLLLGPVMLGFLLFGGLILTIFGKDYSDNGLQLHYILVISAIPDAITNVYVSVLRVQRRLRDAAILNIGMGGLTLVLAWLLIPRLGITGVGWAWMAAEVIGSLAVSFDLLRLRLVRQPDHSTVAP